MRSARAAANVRWPSSARWMFWPSRNWRQGTAALMSQTSNPRARSVCASHVEAFGGTLHLK